MNKVISVKSLSDLKLYIRLSNGREGIFDVSPYIKTDFFRELLDKKYFAKVSVFFNGIGWPRGQDLSPDTIEAEIKEAQTASV